jgi:diaminohydroxyphosphoribosylaminopyrimidine deaminase/5-amino-6-(5-phosphoribosylamino)uracil reductase
MTATLKPQNDDGADASKENGTQTNDSKAIQIQNRQITQPNQLEQKAKGEITDPSVKSCHEANDSSSEVLSQLWPAWGSRILQTQEERCMKVALDAARKHWRESRPNPCVGAAVFRSGELLGTHYSEAAGGPHAESTLLKKLGESVRGAELFVTLEPCAHRAKNPACAPVVAQAGLSKVWIASLDPNPLVAGKGLEILAAHDQNFHLGILEKEVQAALGGFFCWLRKGRPEVWIKTASFASGMMADKTGAPQNITQELTQQWTSHWRSMSDALCIGAKTLLKDSPRLTVRGIADPWAPGHPIPVIWSRSRPKPEHDKALGQLALLHPRILWMSGSPHNQITDEIPKTKLEYFDGIASVEQLLKALGQLGIHRLSVEAGPGMSQMWLDSGLWERWNHWTNPRWLSPQNGIKVHLPQASVDKIIWNSEDWGLEWWSQSVE